MGFNSGFKGLKRTVFHIYKSALIAVIGHRFYERGSEGRFTAGIDFPPLVGIQTESATHQFPIASEVLYTSIQRPRRDCKPIISP